MGESAEKRKPDPVRMKVLRSLPLHIKQSLTKDEVDAFLLGDEWPDSLNEKLKDYIEDEE
jgi:hypothetical protein